MLIRILKTGEVRNTAVEEAKRLINRKLAEPVATKPTDQAETRTERNP